MSKAVIVLLMSIFAINANATKPGTHGGGSTNPLDVTAISSNVNDIGIGINNRDFNTNNLNSSSGSSSGVSNSGNSSNDLNQGQFQGQSVNDSGNSSNHNSAGQLQGQTANNAGNAQHVNFNNPRQHYNNPGLMSVFGVPTANCAIPIGVTGAALGVGGGIMSAIRLDECIKQENVKLAYAIGEQETAMEVFCSMENTKDTLKCMTLNKEINDKKQMLLSVGLSKVSTTTKTNMFGMVWNEQRGWVFP